MDGRVTSVHGTPGGMNQFLDLYKHPDPIEVGCIVLAGTNDLGFGKVSDLDRGKRATVEYFHSVVRQIREEMPLAALTRVKVPHQTR